MHQAVSDRQRLANQENAQKSTGPRSDEGKARVAHNALKHGLLARDVVIHTATESERQADFDALLTGLCKELRPRNLIEETLVERIATCYWRLRRAQRFEAGAIRKALDANDSRADVARGFRDTLEDVERHIDRFQETAELLEMPPEQLAADQARLLAEHVAYIANGFKLAPEDASLDVLKARVQKALPEILRNQHEKVEQLRTLLLAVDKGPTARREKTILLASLPEGDSLTKVVRYETMLDRQLHRALAELRRRRRFGAEEGENEKEISRTNPFDAGASEPSAPL